MKTSDSNKEILKAIFQVQVNMPVIQKSGRNTFFKTTNSPDGAAYPLLEDILEACKPLEKENKIAVMHFVTEENERRYYTTRLYHETGEWAEVTVPLLIGKSDMQGMGSAMTYAKRQNISGIYNIQSEIDDDGNAAAINQNKTKTSPVQNQNQAALKVETKPHPRYTFSGGKFSGKHMRDIPTDQLNNYLAWMEDQNKPNFKTTIEAIYSFLRGEKE